MENPLEMRRGKGNNRLFFWQQINFFIENCVKHINRHYSVISKEVFEWILIADVVDTE